MDERRVPVNYTAFAWGTAAGVFVLAGAVICFILAGTAEIEIISSIYSGEGIIMLLLGIIIICLFTAKRVEVQLNERIYAQNLEIVRLLEELNKKNNVPKEPERMLRDELPPL